MGEEEEKVTGNRINLSLIEQSDYNVPASPATGGGLSLSLSQNQLPDLDLLTSAITEESLIEDLRDPEVVKYEKNLLIDDQQIDFKVFAAWAKILKQQDQQEETRNEDSKVDEESKEEEKKGGESEMAEEVMIKEELKPKEGQQYLIIIKDEKIYFFLKAEGKSLKLKC